MSHYRLTQGKYLSKSELDVLNRLLETFESRDTAMLRLALKTGARAQELLNLTARDLNDENQSVYITGLKRSNDREIPLSPQDYLLAKKYIPFGIQYRRLADIWGLYAPNDKPFHSLRHTFAIELYRRTRDIKLLQVALGHRNISNTMIYADYVFSQEELRRLIL